MFKGRVLLFLLLAVIVLVLVACPRVNSNPEWFLPIGDRSVEETKTLEIALIDHVRDPDGDGLSFSVAGKGLVSAGVYSYTPTIGEAMLEYGESAIYNVTITADDGKGGSASTSFSVTVTPTNRPPVWVTIPDKTVQEGSTLTILLTTYASDPDGDSLTFDVLSGKGEIDGNNYVYTPDYDEASLEYEVAAVYDVVLLAVDTKGATATTDFKVTVTDKNRPPELNIPSPQYVTAGTTLSIDISLFASDPDGDTLVYSKVSGVGSVTGNTYSYSPAISDTGTRNATIRATDGKGGQTDQTIVININPSGINNPPNTPKNPLPADNAMTQPASLVLSWVGGDPDGDPVTYDVYLGLSPTSMAFKGNRTTTTYSTGILNASTKYYWKIVAKDNKGAITQGPVWKFSTAPTKAFEETFQSYPTGIVTGAFGKWLYVEYGSVPNPIITSVAGHTKALFFYGGPNGYSVVYTPFVKLFKLGYLEYDVFLATSVDNRWGWIAPNNTSAFTGIGQLGGSYAILCWTNAGGSYHSEKVMDISPGTWYKVRVIFNLTTGSAAVNVNGVFKKSFTFTPVAGSSGVRMTTSNGRYSYIAFDNISIWVTDTGYVP